MSGFSDAKAAIHEQLEKAKAADNGKYFIDTVGESTLAIEDASTGVSRRGMAAYIEKLNLALIDETKELLHETEGISNAVHESWSGQSSKVFLELLGASISNINDELDREKENLNYKLEMLQVAYLHQDESLTDSLQSQF